MYTTDDDDDDDDDDTYQMNTLELGPTSWILYYWNNEGLGMANYKL